MDRRAAARRHSNDAGGESRATCRKSWSRSSIPTPAAMSGASRTRANAACAGASRASRARLRGASRVSRHPRRRVPMEPKIAGDEIFTPRRRSSSSSSAGSWTRATPRDGDSERGATLPRASRGRFRHARRRPAWRVARESPATVVRVGVAPADVVRALSLDRRRRDAAGDVAWRVARDAALARRGESHAATPLAWRVALSRHRATSLRARGCAVTRARPRVARVARATKAVPGASRVIVTVATPCQARRGESSPATLPCQARRG